MTISASLVMQLRERTGAGMMECKKFLIASNGDIELAINEMRKAGQAKVDKLTSKIAAEGIIVIGCDEQRLKAVMLEINCQTDFVAQDENFTNFANQVADKALAISANDVNDLTISEDLEQKRQALITKVGENIQIRRLAQLSTIGTIGTYRHSNKKIGVLVSLKANNDKAANLEGLAKDMAMHIAANRPLVIHPGQVSQESINTEREIYTARAKESGKPQEVIEKMIEGQLDKYLNEVSLMGQPFIKDPSIKIKQLLVQHNAEIEQFVYFQVGEGIEKKENNFVAEVMAQVRSNE